MGAACRVDFYIVDSPQEEAVELITCRLVDKAWSHGLKVLILAREQAQQARLDRLLWTFRQDSFLPHQALPAETTAPIMIGTPALQLPDGFGMLINLCDEPPAAPDRWQRIAEVSSKEQQRLARTRDRFRHYRQLGLSPDNHALAAPG